MPYATLADLQTHISARAVTRLSDRVTGSVDDVAKITQALAFASSEMDEYLGQLFVLPMAPCTGGAYPPALVEICCDLATFDLYEARSPENARDDRRIQALARLKRYADGTASLQALKCPNGNYPGTLISSASAMLVKNAPVPCNPYPPVCHPSLMECN